MECLTYGINIDWMGEGIALETLLLRLRTAQGMTKNVTMAITQMEVTAMGKGVTQW